jgi:hypothetical protein
MARSKRFSAAWAVARSLNAGASLGSIEIAFVKSETACSGWFLALIAARPDQGAGGFDDVERGSGGQETLAQFAGAGKVNDEDGSAGKV